MGKIKQIPPIEPQSPIKREGKPKDEKGRFQKRKTFLELMREKTKKTTEEGIVPLKKVKEQEQVVQVEKQEEVDMARMIVEAKMIIKGKERE